MATAYGSTASNSKLYGTSPDALTISKPASTAEGDMLIAVLATSGYTANYSLSGWTSLTNYNEGEFIGVRILFKVAGSSEPDDYSFGLGGGSQNNDTMIGFITRITGNSFGGAANIVFSTPDYNSGSATTHTFTPGITPVSTNSVLILGSFVGVASRTQTGYAIANNNPTWTERVDITDTSGPIDNSLAYATAVPSVASATGDYQVTLSSASADVIGFILAVTESANATFNADPLILTSTIPNATVTGDANITATPLTITSTVPDVTVTTEAGKVTNLDKSTTSSVTNLPKS